MAPNESIQFVNGAMADFNKMVTQEVEQRCTQLRDENMSLRDCLKEVQRELIESVKFEADIGSLNDQKIEFLRESIFSMPLDGLESNHNLNLLSKNFKVNMGLLREVRA